MFGNKSLNAWSPGVPERLNNFLDVLKKKESPLAKAIVDYEIQTYGSEQENYSRMLISNHALRQGVRKYKKLSVISLQNTSSLFDLAAQKFVKPEVVYEAVFYFAGTGQLIL